MSSNGASGLVVAEFVPGERQQREDGGAAREGLADGLMQGRLVAAGQDEMSSRGRWSTSDWMYESSSGTR